jgi:hypothetical protein
MATDAGDSARGGRYNSAIGYIYVMSSKYRNLAVIVSEDGSVEFFPNRFPVIRRSDIEENIHALRKLIEDQSVNRGKYGATIN